MKNVTAFLLIAFAATASNAEVINLECKGENANGKKYSGTVTYDTVAGWAADGSGMKIRDGLSAKRIFTILIKVNRETGEFTAYAGDGEPERKGICKKVEVKF